MSALAEIRSAYPAGEAEIVADQSAAGRLSADGLTFYDESAHPLRGREYGSAEPAGARADHQDVEVAVGCCKRRTNSPRLGDIRVSGIMQDDTTDGGHPDHHLRG